MNNLQRVLWLTGLFSVVLASAAQAETSEVVGGTPAEGAATAG